MVVAEMIIGHQCHSQRTLRPTGGLILTSTTTTTVYGTEILDADYDDSCLDANENADADHGDDLVDDAIAKLHHRS
jgi:hypothetical protein